MATANLPPCPASEIMSDRPDRLPHESTAAYARFLAYVAFGPGRILAAVYAAFQGAANGPKGHRVSGQWKRDSVTYRWAERARDWDCHVLAEVGRDVVTAFVDGLRKVTAKVLAALAA